MASPLDVSSLFVFIREREREELMTSCQVEESLPLNLTGRDDYLRQTVLA